MAQQAKVQLLIELKEKIKTGLTQAKEAVSRTTLDMRQKISGFKSRFIGAFNEMKNSLPGFSAAVELIKNPIAIISMGIIALRGAISKLSEAVSRCIADYHVQAEAETKLAAVMRNTMSARAAEVQSIKDLASQQQKLGVIGDEIQLSGAQELATYLTKSANLKKLMPVMNDMIAQQYGLNATQEAAVNIASMMGKVMDGQVGALSRYGYKFSEAQAKILKFGTEEQRAATLADVVSSAVGGVNAALAATPEGKLKQYNNDMGDLRERFGAFFISMQAAFMPFYNAIRSAWTRILSFFEAHKATVLNLVTTLANALVTVFSWVWNAVKTVIDIFRWWHQALADGQPVVVAITFALKWAAIAIGGVAAIMGVVKLATTAWTVAVRALSLALWSNPITWVIALCIALGAAIYYVTTKTSGWGETWGNIVKYMQLSWEQGTGALKLTWLVIENALMTGFETVAKGWYFVSSLWDDEADAKSAAMDKAAAARDVEIAKQRALLDDLGKEKADLKIWQVKVNEGSLADAKKKITGALGVQQQPNSPVAGNEPGIVAPVVAEQGETSPDATSGVTGAARQIRNITVNIDAFNKGGINTQNTEGLQGLTAEQIEDWFNQMLLRNIRNLELSM